MISPDDIKKLDTADVLTSVKNLPKQISQVIEDVDKINFPDNYRSLQNIVIGGMGGSIYSAIVINSLFERQISVPVIAANNYVLPTYVGPKTLFIGSSYSGSTEEVLTTTGEAIEKGAQVAIIAAGSKLAETAKEKNLSAYIFDPRFNPSGQPRVGLGYMIFGTIQILVKLGYLTLDASLLAKAVQALESSQQEIEQTALATADKIDVRVAIFIASEHLVGATHVTRNQMNETAKSFAEYHPVPELNHHLLEGLSFPKELSLSFLFYQSSHYSAGNSKRMKLTKEVVEQQKKITEEVVFSSSNTIEEFLKFLQFGSYLSFYLAMKHQLDPSKIPWVDFFKQKLSE